MITVFTGLTCAPCHSLKRYLNYKGIKFIEKPIEQRENAAEAYKLAGLSIVPVTVINDRVVVGYNLSKINELLSA